MLDKANISKIIEDYIKAIESTHFQDFCDRLLLMLYPNDYTPVRAGGKHGDMKNDGYCFISRQFFQAHASRGEKASKIKKKIEGDLDGCLQKQQNVEEFIYITNDTMIGEVQHFIDNLRTQHEKVIINTWDPKKLALKIAEQSIENIEYIIDRKLTYSTEVKSEENDFGILNEILEYCISLLPQTEKENAEQSKLIKILTKISLNFPEEQRQEVKEIISRNWHRKILIDKFVQSQMESDSTKIDALLDLVQGKYRNITGKTSAYSSIDDLTIFDKIGQELLPPTKINNPDYNANAKAIVLYFFEFCDIGKKTQDDPVRQKSLFEDM